MSKKNLRYLLILVAVILAIYQVWTEEPVEERAAISDAPATAVQDEVAEEPSLEAAEEVDPEAPPTEEPATIPEEAPALEEADGDFDYWVMALSWSPDYCATNDYQDAQQCSIGKQLDFVLHGLWPQYDKGYPSYCSDEELPYDLKDAYTGLYPNNNLFDHEWEKHGTCSGLTPEGYLEWSETLKEGLVIPAEYDSPLEPFRADADSLQAAFVESNPSFPANAFAVYCSGSGRFLKEMFVCYEKNGDPRECSSEVLSKAAKSCGQPDFLVRNTR